MMVRMKDTGKDWNLSSAFEFEVDSQRTSAAELLGRLIERLNEDGQLSDKRILELLGSDWEKSNDSY